MRTRALSRLRAVPLPCRRPDSSPTAWLSRVRSLEPEARRARARCHQLLPAVVALADHAHRHRDRRWRVARQHIDVLPISRLVHLEPLHQLLDHARHHTRQVGRRVDLRRKRVVEGDDDDLVVELALVDELQVGEHLDRLDLAHLERGRADLHHVEWVVVARRAIEPLDRRILPRLRQHAIVEEGGAVRVVAERSLLLVLHDRVVRHLLLHLQLGRRQLGDFAHEVDDVASRAGGVERQIVPRRDGRHAVRANKRGGEAQLAKRLLGGGAHVGRGGDASELLGVGHPVARLLPDVVVGDDLPPLRHHEAGRDALGLDQIGRNIERARLGAESGELAHLGARDGDEVVLARRVTRAHRVVLLVVVHLLEAEELHVAHAGRRHEDIAAVVGVVEVVALVGARRVGHARRVAPHGEEGGARDAARLGVELHLGRPGVDHGRRPDGHDGPVRVQLARRHHLVVLLDAHVERHIRRLRPAAER
mmetsp:Transcript_53937/g.142010  ORF Transcript_53937/g.142010 Transcript_53937/m.142010 type:complete len:478 (-) Transcript_53937:1889-3322(-)